MNLTYNTMDKNLSETIKVWPKVSKIISTLNTKDQYNNAVKLLDKLIGRVSLKTDVVSLT